MLRKDEWINKKFVGCISYKFPEKCPRINIEQIIKEQENKDIDVIGLYTPHATFKWGEYVQPGCITILAQIIKIINDTDIESFLNKKPFYCNYWICRPQILLKYIYFIDEIIEKIEMNPSICDLLYNNSGYSGTINVDKQYRLFGKPFYTWHPFIMERLLPLFCHMNNYKIYLAPYFSNGIY